MAFKVKVLANPKESQNANITTICDLNFIQKFSVSDFGRLKPYPLLFFILLLSQPHLSYGAACCGGGFSAPSLITGDDQAQITNTYSFNKTKVDYVSKEGTYNSWNKHQTNQVLRLEGALAFGERMQAGFSLPYQERSLEGQRASGLGDTSLLIGYEYLTDWSYQPILPKGTGYVQLTLPTGRSRADADSQLESRGNGYWALGVGTFLNKSFGKVDCFTSFEIHHSFAKNYQSHQMKGTETPGWGGHMGLGAGYNTQLWRWGTSITWFYEDPIALTGDLNYSGAVERYGTTTLSTSYLISREWTVTFIYSDQTLFGNPVNTSLAQGISFQVQKRWTR
ncbi:MAG: hypothetical protein K1X29_04480 [Bdellovibrionales bacterium]|nr:hypothetical protein [Bdellovibrionales bacterium]